MLRFKVLFSNVKDLNSTLLKTFLGKQNQGGLVILEGDGARS